MLNNLSDQTRECLEQRGGLCAESRRTTGRLSIVTRLSQFRKLDLARSFQLGEQLTDFTNEAMRQNRSSYNKCFSYDV